MLAESLIAGESNAPKSDVVELLGNVRRSFSQQLAVRSMAYTRYLEFATSYPAYSSDILDYLARHVKNLNLVNISTCA